jgi:uncharacterized iron-regulated membrane protein
MVLLAWVAATGTILTVDELFDQQAFATPGTRALLDGSKPLLATTGDAQRDEAQLAAWVARSLRAAMAASPGVAPTTVHVQLRMREGVPIATVTLAENAASPAFSALNGERVAVVPGPVLNPALPEGRRGPPSFNELMQSLHGGHIAGDVGAWLILLTGTLFIALSVTGIWIYVQMFNVRRRLRRTQWFWR